MFSDTSVIIGLFSLLGVLCAAAFTAWTANRVKSGKIATSEATQLWQESGNMRKELKEEIIALKEELRILKAENVSLREENVKWRQRFDDMQEALDKVKIENTGLRGRVYDLEQERLHG